MRIYRGLRRRWLLNTVGVICALGLVCVAIVTASFAGYSYANMEADMRHRAASIAEFFAHYLNHDPDEYYESCVHYAQTFEDWDILELQFIDVRGQIVAASNPDRDGKYATTPEVRQSLRSRQICAYMGQDTILGERILSVCVPLLHTDTEVIGVFRYISSTGILDIQILAVALISLVALMVILLILLISSNYYIHSILEPVAEITEKAKRITSGIYGMQLQAKYDDEIGELVDTINEMSTQINQNEIMQRDFISSLSHELRTPLTAITGWSETILASEELDAESRRGVQIIRREAQRLTEMVLELLDFTKIQDGRMTLNMQQADIRDEFEDTVFMYGSRLAQEGIELNYQESDGQIPQIPCDPKRMRQVFLNILDNAARHGGEGGQIDASIGYDGESVFICIRDYGPGIEEDELPLVKKKFYKGSNVTRGSGIGLAVSDEIVQMHGGNLTLENAPDGGTLVTIRLPAAQ